MALQIITEIPLASGDITPDDNPHFYIEVGGVFRRLTLPQLIDCINEDLNVSGLSNAAKQALLNCFEHVAWVDDQGQTYYDALYDALYPRPTSISAVFTQGQHVIYDTQSLDDLRQYLVVKATFEDGMEHTVVNYTLSGTLTAGTSTITVTYENCTDTFEVNVTENAGYITAEYTQSGTVYDTDTLSDLKSDLVVTYYETQQTEQGVVLTDEDYTLSGTLEVGVSTITVEYLGLTNTFGVTVAADPAYITAVFTQPQTTIYMDDALDTLKSNLVVTLFRRPGEAGTVLADSAYTLSGTLAVGTNTVGVAYGNYTTTFTVTDVVDFYNQSVWSLANGLLFTTDGGGGRKYKGDGHGGAWAAITNAHETRRTFYTIRGLEEFVNMDDTSEVLSGKYPIPIPDDATQITLAISPNTLAVGGSALYWSDQYDEYIAIGGWSINETESTVTTLLPSGTKRFFCANVVWKADRNAEIQNEPTAFSVTFSSTP